MRIKFSSAFWILLFFASGSVAEESVPNPGPRSEANATFLFQEGSSAFAAKKYSESIRSLEKLIDRYPTYEKINEAYLDLLEALLDQKKNNEVLSRGKDFLALKLDRETANRTRTFLAEANLNLQQYLDARLLAEELLKNEPNTRQKLTAVTIKFQTYLEEKQYSEAHNQLDALITLLEKDALDPFKKMIPEFKMTLAMRECLTSHLLKGKEFTEEEVTDYFKEKNLCFKEALPAKLDGVSGSVIHEWCESFTYLNHELQRLKIDPFLKSKVDKELKETFEFTKPISPELSKCYEPLKPPVKSKKRHRKRRVHAS